MEMFNPQNYINSLLKFGVKLGLERMEKLLELLGNPQDKLKFVHVAGTNGKGSTSTMIANILTTAGYKTGLFTSPFILEFNERFKIDNQNISNEQLLALTLKIKAVLPLLDEQITEFEFITALAFLHFEQQNCDIVVLEVGLGGRFDATNVIKKPLACVITSISFDHVHILGDTIEKIAFEKCGIIKDNADVLVYPKQNTAALEVITAVAKEKNATVLTPNYSLSPTMQTDNNILEYKDIVCKLKLYGKHQLYNAVTAIETALLLRDKKGLNIPASAITHALENTSLIARQHWFRNDILIDGSHNVEGISMLCETLETIEQGKVVLMGMLADKDYEQSLEKIAGCCHSFIATGVDNPRALAADTLADCAKKYCDNTNYNQDQLLALKLAFQAKKKDDILVVCGSLYLVGEIYRLIADNFDNLDSLSQI